MAPRVHLFGLVTSAALLLALSGCGDDESPEPNLDPTPTEETSPTDATSSPTSKPSEPFDAEGSETHAGRLATDGPDERAVAEAWVAYWEVRGTAYHEAEVDADALGEVARGEAVEEVVNYVAQLQNDGEHLVGDTRVGVSEVEIQGSSAAVQGCLQGKRRVAGEAPGPLQYATVVGTLTKAGGTWLVDTKTVTGEKKCKA